MHIVPVNPNEPREDRVRLAVDALRSGTLLALPTETFYGLAVDCANEEALRRLNRIKGKPESSPILLLIGERSQAATIMASTPAGFDTLVETFWPGPLTLVVPAAPSLAAPVSAGRGTVAMRLPGLALPRAVARQLGRPITGVSANLYGQPPCRTAPEVAGAFPQGLDWILDGGPTPGGAPSTIVDLSVAPPRVLRAGLVPPATLQPFLPELAGP